MLAVLLERWETADTHLRAALASARALGSVPLEAVAHLHLARLAAARRQPDTDRHTDAALALARRVGMTPLLTAAGSGPTRSPLSARERQVAGLVAEGLSNRQIAQRLHLSERTAENHVTHILTKLGFESRARIAAWHVSTTMSASPDGPRAVRP